MKGAVALLGALGCLFLSHEVKALQLEAPTAPQKPYVHREFGTTREDPYFWLKERENPEVIRYLEAENTYTAAQMAPTEKLQKELVQEFLGRVEKVDESYPAHAHGYAYFSRTLAHQDYPAYYRYPLGNKTAEELLVDGNELAKGQSYMALTRVQVSPDDRYLAYAVDRQGRRFYTIEVLERQSRKLVMSIPQVTGDFEWGNDSQSLVYTKQDAETLRASDLYVQKLGAKKAKLLYRERDETFSVSLSKSLSETYLFLQSSSTVSDEWRFVEASHPDRSWKLIQKRERDLKYSVDDGGSEFYILSNYRAKNFQVFETSYKQTDKKYWKSIVGPDADVYRTELEAFDGYLVLHERKGGLGKLRILNRKTKTWQDLTFPDADYVLAPYSNGDFKTPDYLYSYESMVNPTSVYRFDFAKGEAERVYQKQIAGKFDASLYTSERFWITARDGVKVPMSLVYKKGLKKDGTNPLLLYGYGSYGVRMEPRFSQERLSLLDRGFVYALSYIRGGSELGRSWYEDGKLLKKKNTFQDYIDCAQYLVDEKWTSPAHLYAMGGSAGGLLMGAVVNMRPELFKAVVAQVPFVDVMTSMLDASIPLTTGEYDEWGDPRKKVFYDYMKSYSPYDNVKAQAYPNLLVTTGLHDSQVQYWEPAKWVARLRTMKTNDSLLLLKTNMNAGHGGASGRAKRFEEIAFDYAFMLQFEISGEKPAT